LLAVGTQVQAEPTPVPVNFCENGGFEIATTPDVPDCWQAYLQPKRTSNWYAHWVLDRNVAFEGKASMRLSLPDKGGYVSLSYAAAINSWQRIHPFGMPVTSESGDYTLSLSMKSAQGTVKVGGKLIFYAEKYAGPLKVEKLQFEVGPEWKRYSHTVSDTQARMASISIGAPAQGAVWIDAMQLEEGKTAHDYVPCLHDCPAEQAVAVQPGLSIACDVVKGAPQFDGRLDDECWKNVRWVDDFQVHLKGGSAVQQTQAAMAWDGRSLYIAFRCSMPGGEGPRTHKRAARDKLIWGKEDMVEVFLDTNGDGVSYLHFAANAGNVQYDASCNFHEDTPDPVCDLDWNGQWQVAAGKEKDAWTAEIAIPMATLARWGIGDFSGIALCRENAATRENSYWGGPFHSPTRFARLTGIKGKARRYAYSFDDLSVQFRDLAEATYCVTVRVRNETGAAQMIRPSATLLFGEGDAQQRLANGDLTRLDDGEERIFRFGSLTFPAEVRECATTINLLGDKGELLAMTHNKSLPISVPITIRPRFTLFTTEKIAPIAVDLSLADDVLGKAAVELGISGQTVNPARKRIQPIKSRHFECPLSIHGLPAGDHRVEAKLLAPDGKIVAKTHCELRKRPPARDVVQIDTVRRCLVVNGDDFFPYICTFMRIPEPEWRLAEAVREIRNENFNTLWATFNKTTLIASDEKIRTFLDLAHEAGLKVSYWIAPLGKDKKTGEWGLLGDQVFYDRVRHTVSKFKDHPAILAWCLVDEPSKFHLEDKDPRWLEKMYRLATDIDPYHPVYAEWREHELEKQHKQNGGTLPLQIASTHRYVIPTAAPAAILPRIDFMVRKRSEGWKPTWFFAQDWAGMGRAPTPDETTCMVYLALTHGMTGVGYWHGAWPDSGLVKTRMGEIGKELEQLAPHLMSRDRSDRVVSEPDSIHALLRGTPECTVLISVNTAAETQESILDLRKAEGGPFKRAVVLFENRTADVRDGKIHDRFQPYERHVYRLQR